jgi:alpha-tubulin suppressor-like RCC1 family protein
MQQVNSAIAAGTWPKQPVQTWYAWGGNSAGNLGIGNTTSYSSPKQISSLTNWLSMSGGYSHTAYVDATNKLYVTGDNSYGQLGLGNTTNISSFTQVGALTTWASVGSGGFDCAAIKTDGTLWTWGRNTFGQLGLSSYGNSYSSPKQVGSLTTWSKVIGGGNFTIAVKTDGTLWAWGRNVNGYLGLNDTTQRNSPVQVGALTNWTTKIGSGGQQTFAIKTDGTLWAWGGNNFGTLGTGNTTYYSSPKQIGALTTWSDIAPRNNYVIAVKTDGTLWAWGRNVVGGLGTGNTTTYSSPKQIGALTNWSTLPGSGMCNIITTIKTDGTLWTWGSGVYGGLGLGNTTYYSSPKQIGSLTTWQKAVNTSSYDSVIGIAIV